MTNQTLDFKRYNLQVLSPSELTELNGGHWIKYVWKAFQSLEIADGINDAVNGLKEGFNSGYSRGHGASGSW
jgi:hypothetical protein